MNSNSRVRLIQTDILSDAWATLSSVQFDFLRSSGEWQRQQREIYNRGHGAAVLLYEKQRRRVVLVRQFRYPVHQDCGDGMLVEVPAGVLEHNDPERTIRAEAEQETGFTIRTLKHLFNAYVSPGSVTECIHYYIAEYRESDRSGTGGGLADEGEDIEVLEVPFDEALGWIGSGKITDAKTIILLQYAALHVFPPDC